MTGLSWGCLLIGFIAGTFLGPMLLGVFARRNGA